MAPVFLRRKRLLLQPTQKPLSSLLIMWQDTLRLWVTRSKIQVTHFLNSLPFVKFATNEAIQRTEAYEYAQSLGAQADPLPNFQVSRATRGTGWSLVRPRGGQGHALLRIPPAVCADKSSFVWGSQILT